jgi:hypothetical protein
MGAARGCPGPPCLRSLAGGIPWWNVRWFDEAEARGLEMWIIRLGDASRWLVKRGCPGPSCLGSDWWSGAAEEDPSR